MLFSVKIPQKLKKSRTKKLTYGDDIVDEIYVDRYRSDDAAEVEERIRQQSSQSSSSISGMRVLDESSIPTKDDDKVVDQVAKPTTSDGNYWL